MLIAILISLVVVLYILANIAEDLVFGRWMKKEEQRRAQNRIANSQTTIV